MYEIKYLSISFDILCRHNFDDSTGCQNQWCCGIITLKTVPISPQKNFSILLQIQLRSRWLWTLAFIAVRVMHLHFFVNLMLLFLARRGYSLSSISLFCFVYRRCCSIKKVFTLFSNDALSSCRANCLNLISSWPLIFWERFLSDFRWVSVVILTKDRHGELEKVD